LDEHDLSWVRTEMALAQEAPRSQVGATAWVRKNLFATPADSTLTVLAALALAWGVPRLLFSDFPLGNAAGRPNDPASQDATLELALRTLEAAPGSRTTVQSPQRWSESADWKLDYCNVERLGAEEIGRRRAEFDEAKRQATKIRDTELGTRMQP